MSTFLSAIIRGAVSYQKKMACAFDIYQILSEISKANQDLRDTFNESVKGATAMGVSTFVGAVLGGLMGGQKGMFAGGSIGFAGGATYAAANTKSFKSLHQVLSEMNEQDRKKLVEVAIAVIQREGINLTQQVVGKYGSQFARMFLIEVYKEFIGK